MRRRRFRLRLLLVVVATTLMCASVADAGEATRVSAGPKRGWSVEVPAQWSDVPADEVADIVAAAKKRGVKTVFEWRYVAQARPGPPWVVYPYLLVQYADYSAFGASSRPTEGEIREIAKATMGVDISDDDVSSTTGGLVKGGATFRSVRYDDKEHRLVAVMDMQVTGVGKVTGQIVQIFGKDGLYQFNLYASSAHFEDEAHVAKLIADTAHLGAKTRFQPKPASGKLRWLLSLLVGAIGGVVIHRFAKHSG